MGSTPIALTIVVTDSGLGGLSTTADLYNKLQQASRLRRVDLVFFNALADPALGYQAMGSTAQKVAVFQNALQCMYDRYHPDYLLIACNTLSVLHEQTDFTRSGVAPVVGIVDTSVRQMLDCLRASPETTICIFGTKTTIDSGTYPRRLAEAGIAPERIVPEACATALILAIERDAAGPETQALIRTHVAAALARGRGRGPVAASLNCTHYGYAEAFFREAFAAEGVTLRALLNPNTAMGDFLVAGDAISAEMARPEVAVRVVSQAAIDAPTMECMTRLIAQTAPAVATALHGYEHDPSLFAWRGVGV